METRPWLRPLTSVEFHWRFTSCSEWNADRGLLLWIKTWMTWSLSQRSKQRLCRERKKTSSESLLFPHFKTWSKTTDGPLVAAGKGDGLEERVSSDGVATTPDGVQLGMWIKWKWEASWVMMRRFKCSPHDYHQRKIDSEHIHNNESL